MTNRVCLFVLLLFAAQSMWAQYALEKKLELKQKWPDSEAVIGNYKVKIWFEIDEETHQPIAKQREVIDIVPTTVSNIERMYFYDQNSQINFAKCRMNGKRKQFMQKVSGDWERDGIFHSDHKFAHYGIPTFKAAEFYQFEIEKQYNNIRYLTRFFLNDMIYPIEKYVLEIVIPKWLNIDVEDFRFEYFDVKKTVVETATEQTLRFTANNIVKFLRDEYFLSMAHSYPHVLFLPKSFYNKEQINIFNNLESMYSFYQELVGSLDCDKGVIQPVLNQILKGSLSKKDSIERIYYWVQDNIRYLAFVEGIAGFRPEPAHVVLSNKYGDCKGMANLLKTMLTMAGFDARLAWIGTKHLIYDYSTPSLGVDNHMITYLFFDGQDYFLDATQKNRLLGDNGDLLQGKQVLVENGSEYELKTIPNSNALANLVKSNARLKGEGDKLIGKVEVKYHGESAYLLKRYLQTVNSMDQEDFLRKLLAKKGKHKVDSLVYDDINSRSTSFELAYHVIIEGKLSSFGKDKYVSFDFLDETTNLPSDTLKGNHLYNGYKPSFETDIVINLQPNEQVVFLPANEADASNGFEFKVKYQADVDKVVCHRKMSIDSSLIEKKQFVPYIRFLREYSDAKARSAELKTD